MTPGHVLRLLLHRNMLYCASQQERKPESMTRPSTALAITAVVLGCAPGSAPAAAEDAKPIQTGAASWYGPGFHGKKTANGERFNTNDLTAAHKTLPFGTRPAERDPYQGCMRDEAAARSELQRQWAQFDAGNRDLCAQETRIGGYRATSRGFGAQIRVRGFGEAKDGSIGSASPIVWMTDALQGQ